MKKILLAAVLGLSSASAFAGSVDMTCAQAKNYYDTHGRINVRVHGTVVPIYGLEKRCQSGFTAHPYFVSTTDSRTCVLGNRCYQDRGSR